MKKYAIIYLFTSILVTIFFSCKKSPVIADTDDVIKLKRILNAIDTITPLCSPSCPASISRNEEEFIYDNLNRLTKRLLVKRNISNVPETIDTISIFNYSYSDNSATIFSYSERTNNSNIEVFHTLSYDAQNRILKDSVTNPQTGNNKVTKFAYFQDTIIQVEQQNFIAGTEIKIDTMILLGSNIVKEKIKGIGSRELVYTVSGYKNPLSYVNNFSLLASDLKNGSNSTLFMINTPQYITYNMTSETRITTSSTYISTFTIKVDSLNRVISFTKSANGNKVTSFEYY
jgi:hypothetical protein